MNTINLCICDDEAITAKYYGRELKRRFDERHVKTKIRIFTDPEKLLDEIRKGFKWDVYFLDIDMKGINGIELARQIRVKDKTCRIIFLSIHEEMVYDTFQVNAYRFIPKNMFHSRIGECIDSLIEDNDLKNPDLFVIEVGTDIYRYPVGDIVYIRSVDKYLNIHLNQGDSPYVRYQIKAAADALEPFGFIKPHKSYLVNFHYITRIEGNKIYLDDGSEIPISRYRANDVRTKYRMLTL